MDTTVLKSADEIAHRVFELAGEMRRLSAGPIVLVPVLMGGMTFCADLARQLPSDTKIYPFVVRGRFPVSRPVFHHPGHDVWIVDNTLQTGESLKTAMRPWPMARSVVLARLPTRSGVRAKDADLVGWDIPAFNVVGYGGDHCWEGRGLTDLRQVISFP